MKRKRQDIGCATCEFYKRFYAMLFDVKRVRNVKTAKKVGGVFYRLIVGIFLDYSHRVRGLIYLVAK